MSDDTNPEFRKDRPVRSKRATVLAAAVVATLAAAGIGGPAALRSLTTNPAPTPELRAAQIEEALGLGELTLDELADELAAMDLIIEVSPSSSPDTADDLAPDESPDEFPNTEADEDLAADEDPFAGMTDKEIDALSDDEFFAILEEAGWEADEDGYFDEDSADGTFDEEDGFDQQGEQEDDPGSPGVEAPLASFVINGDSIDLSGTTPAVAEGAQEIWGRFVELIPADQRHMVTGFELLDEEYGGAHVYPTDADPSKWVLGVGMGLGNDLDYVLIHEFGHLLTLQATEVPPGGNPGSCATYHTGEGCALSGSTFAGFVQSFWPAEMLEEINRIQESEDWEAADAFYQEHQEEFVTDYATTNPAEDLAETFAVFVTGDRPAGNTIADQKVQFLWNDPAMVALRAEILANM